MCRTERKIRLTQYLSCQVHEKNWAILYIWTTTDRMVTGFSLNDRPKEPEHTPGLSLTA